MKSKILYIIIFLLATALVFLVIGCRYYLFPNKQQPIVQQVASTTPNINVASIKSYTYLFEAQRDANSSNIVGYFGHGAFAWYVPEWLYKNWTMVKTSSGMIFTPEIRENEMDFSDITFVVATSTEIYNASSLYEAKLNKAHAPLIRNEVLLNKNINTDPFANNISMNIDNDTRIYHITDTDQDTNRTRDSYYMDGKDQTLTITIETKPEIFSQFSEAIRDMVEGIGDFKVPQG